MSKRFQRICHQEILHNCLPYSALKKYRKATVILEIYKRKQCLYQILCCPAYISIRSEKRRKNT